MEDGYYTMKGVAGGLGNAKTGTPQIAVQLVVSQGPAKGESITWFGTFTDNATEYTFAALRTLGWEGDDLTNLAGLDKNEVRVHVKTEEYQGKWNQKAKGIYPLGGLGLANPMSERDAKAFAATMKGAAVASRSAVASAKPANGKPKAKPAARQQPAGRGPDFADMPNDDDIPF